MPFSLRLRAIGVILISTGCTTSPGAPTAVSTDAPPQSTNAWYASGARTISRLTAQRARPARARNVILFIGDGMSLDTITAARIYAGQADGGDGEGHTLVFETLPHTALLKTYTTNMQVPDSAGTATAMLSGVKTRSGYLGVTEFAPVGKCDPTTDVESFLERAAESGKATGIVSTARITHATPAATYAHVPQRNYEHDGELPDDVEHNCIDIARQLVNFRAGDGLSVILGGGRRGFLPTSTADPEYADRFGRRQDGRNLIADWQARHGLGAHVAYTASELAALDPVRIDRVLGLFEPSHMMYEADRVAQNADEPSLADMTGFAIQRLNRDKDGFFLLVEGGRIDHAHHAGNAARALADTVALDDAVNRALELVDLNETLVIVTADHGHVMSMSGYPQRNNPILGKVRQPRFLTDDVPSLAKDSDGLPYTTLSYANGPGHRHDRPDLTDVDTTDVDFRQEATIPLRSETHSGTDVIVYADGPGATLFRGVHEQNVLYHVMRHAVDAP
ncbi:MAG: alkaline phosphatase [Pseudomonadota bacterium]